MNRTIQLDDFENQICLYGLKPAPTAEAAVFTAAGCSIADNRYHTTLQLCRADRVEELKNVGPVSLYEWESDQSLFLIWNNAGAATMRRYDITTNTAVQAAVFPMEIRQFCVVDGETLAVLIQKDRFSDDPLVHKAWEIFDELPVRQNAVGYVCGKRGQLCLLNIRTGSLTPVTQEPFDCESVRITPDRSSLIYAGRSFTEQKVLDHILCRYEISEGRTTTILDKKEKLFLGFYDCDDSGVCFTATDCSVYGFGRVKDVYRYDFETGTRSLFYRAERNIGTTEVISDCRRGALTQFQMHGGWLYAGSTDGYRNEIYRYRSGRAEKLVPIDGSADAMCVTSSGTILTIAMIGQRLQELYVCENGVPRRVSCFNEDYYTQVQPVKPTHFRYTNDGVELDGWALLPKGFDESRTYPAILDVHGGPRLVYGETYFHEMQAWCAKGYVVLYCNPRGSSGRGNEFSNLWNPQRLGDIDFRDVMACVDAALERWKNIDPRRIGETGGSYGGFMTNWIIGHTDRFACAVSQRSIANWFLSALVSDNGYWDHDRIAKTDPWTDVEELWRLSPVRYAPNCTTPTLFIHAFEDYRCPFEAGLQMFTALRMHHVPARLVAFYNENHELSRNGQPRNRKKRLDEITAWFETYLAE